MRSSIKIIGLLLLGVSLNSCFLLGIHFNVHNPKKAGKIPEFSEEIVLLGELNKYRTCFNVHYYDLSLKVDPEEKILDGEVQIYAKAEVDFDTLQIDLHENFQIDKLVDFKTKRALSYSRKERAIYIEFPHKAEDHFAISIQYKGTPVKAKKPPWKGGFTWKKDKNKKPWIGVSCESEGASLWWPLKDHTSDEPDSMRLHYTVPKGLMAIGNGQLESKIDSNELSTFNWFVSYPINTYNVTIYVGDFKLIEDKYKGVYGDSMLMTHYVLPENFEKAQQHFKQLHEQINLFEKRFGEYPWYDDGFKLVEAPFAGMEHQTAIAYGSGYKNDLTRDTDYIILHETAHEWWGNSITADDMAHVWLQEGFASYAEALFLEHKYDKSRYDMHLMMYRWFIKNKYPLVSIEGRRWFHFRKNSDVYMKGAWVLHMLRVHLANDSLFFSLIKDFAIENYAKMVDSQDFIDFINKRTSENLQWFFNQYLYKNEVPELVYEISDEGVLYYRWANVEPEFNQLKIRIYTGQKQMELLPSTEVQSVKIQKNEDGNFVFDFIDRLLIAHKEVKHLSDQ